MKNYSIWEDLNNNLTCKSISQDMDVDVLIVGGGITGISVLINLMNSKLKTILIEKNKCGLATTSKSTAKITYLQEKIYMNIRNLINEDTASFYLDSQRYATNLLKNLIEKNEIDCDLKKVDSYLFTDLDSNKEKLEEEYKFLKNNKVNVEKVTSVSFDKNCKLALKVSDTYVFHPLKYINYWKNKYKDLIYENSKLTKINKVKDYYECLVNGRIIKTKYVVIASHYPYFLLPFLLPIKSHIETSYIGAKKEDKTQNISAINIDKPTKSLRYHHNYLIYLYNSFKSANIKSVKDNFEELNKIDKFQYMWSNNDIITNDYLPFIGRIKDNLFIATGYNTWGMTNGTLAGEIIKDLILEKENKYIKLFDPNREINLSKIIRFPSDLYSNIKAICKSTKNNVNNNLVINKIIKGQKVLVYKDSKGIEHIVLNKCPHMKCGIVFNEKELIWECLCHGSRFDIDGKCINGPSNLDITFK